MWSNQSHYFWVALPTSILFWLSCKSSVSLASVRSWRLAWGLVGDGQFLSSCWRSRSRVSFIAARSYIGGEREWVPRKTKTIKSKFVLLWITTNDSLINNVMQNNIHQRKACCVLLIKSSFVWPSCRAQKWTFVFLGVNIMCAVWMCALAIRWSARHRMYQVGLW